MISSLLASVRVITVPSNVAILNTERIFMPPKFQLHNLFPVELLERARWFGIWTGRRRSTVSVHTVSVVSVPSPTLWQQQKTTTGQGQNQKNTKKEMAGARASGMIKGGRSIPRRYSGRPIPKRGQVKVGIVVGLANSVVSIFSRSRARGCSTPTHLAP
ncbi:hypothetical protein E2542_SST16374 [Spatholobus suberectus]|nr:hypothetical protein E2542_SST16374 [Spatholobus suberectus]